MSEQVLNGTGTEVAKTETETVKKPAGTRIARRVAIKTATTTIKAKAAGTGAAKTSKVIAAKAIGTKAALFMPAFGVLSLAVIIGLEFWKGHSDAQQMESAEINNSSLQTC